MAVVRSRSSVIRFLEQFRYIRPAGQAPPALVHASGHPTGAHRRSNGIFMALTAQIHPEPRDWEPNPSSQGASARPSIYPKPQTEVRRFRDEASDPNCELSEYLESAVSGWIGGVVTVFVGSAPRGGQQGLRCPWEQRRINVAHNSVDSTRIIYEDFKSRKVFCECDE